MRHLRAWLLIPATGWVLFELAFAGLTAAHLYRPNADGTYYGAPIRAFDAVRGYRWVNGGTRIARIMKGDVAFDTRIRVNASGHIGASSCLPRKRAGTYRIVVFGDSFTDASYLTRTWVDTVNSMASRIATPRLEFCSFAVDGGGLLNWESALRREVIAELEFDAVILAVFGDDLVRGFIAFADSADTSHFRMLRQAPSDAEAEAVRSSLLACPAAPIVSEDDIDFLIDLSRGRVGWRPNASRYAWLRWRGWRSTRKDPAACHFYLPPAERDRILDQVVGSLLRSGKAVIVATVPGRGPLLTYIREGTHTPERDFDEAFARRFGLPYFDGYRALASNRRGSPGDWVDRLWLPHDGHWNQTGSDLFATMFFEFLRQDVLPHRAAH